MARANWKLKHLNIMQIQSKLRLKQLQRKYLKARYEVRGK